MSFQEATDSLSVMAQNLSLAPLQEPDPVPFTFETIGWKVLAAVLIVMAAATIIALIRHYRKNRYRRQALSELNQLTSAEQLGHGLITLKRTAISIYGREQVASLTGAPWYAFLDEKTKGKTRLSSYEAQLSAYVFEEKVPAESDRKAIIEQIENWIKNHRATS